ncbi:hypothetical protein C8R44DRAFT_925813, partial [Mycena epipterygia]
VDPAQAHLPEADFRVPSPEPPQPPSLPAKRIRRPTAKALQALEDPLPEGPGPLQEDVASPEPETLTVRVPRLFRTAANSFGLSRIYRRKPTAIPDMDGVLDDRVAAGLKESSTAISLRTLRDIIWPYPNLSSWLFGKWFWNEGDKKTITSRKGLLDILLSGAFRIDDLRGVNFDKIDNVLGTTDTSEMAWEGNGWKTSTVTIKIPTAKRWDNVDPEADKVEVRKFDIPGFHHRSLIHVMRSIIEFDDAAKSFHWHPFEQYWTPQTPFALGERVHDELYCSPAWIEADRKLQSSPPEPGCTLPRVIAGFMFWSDATHVAQFGQAKLWPVYAYFGNQSKYSRAQPSARASSQVAYLQSLPDTIQDFIRKAAGKGASDQLLAHCRRELFHESWKLMLDDEFIEAYRHGIVLDCVDGIRRRVYPRIFTFR